MKKGSLLILLLYFLSSVNLKAQIDENRIKASALFYICNYVEWPNSSNVKSFNIGILGKNKSLTDELNLIARDKKIKGNSIQITEFLNIEDIKQVQVLFVNESFNSNIKDIFNLAQSKNILLISNNVEANLYSMINFVNDKRTGKIGFEVNKQNLLLGNFNYSDELLLYGGSIVDIKELYKNTQSLLEKNTLKVATLEQENAKKEAEIEEKNSSITNLQKLIKNSSTTLKILNDSISQQQVKIESESEKFQNQKKLYEQTQKDNLTLNSLHIELKDKIEESQNNIIKLDKEISKREKQIKEQVANIEQKDFLLKTKNRILILLIGFGLSLLLIGLLLLNAYRSKRKSAELLEKKVEERTLELKSANINLLDEIAQKEMYSTQLALSEQNYREIFNASTEAIFIHSAVDGKILDVNESMLQLYGYQRQDIEHLEFNDLCSGVYPYNYEGAGERIKLANTEGKQIFEWLAKNKKQKLFWVEVALRSTKIGGNQRILAAVRDIDEKKKYALELDNYRKNLERMVKERTQDLENVNMELKSNLEELNSLNEHLAIQKRQLEATIAELNATQDKLIQSEKLASLGIFTAGIAHEINNPINYISTGSQVLFELMDTIIKGVDIKDEELLMEIEEMSAVRKAIETGIEKTTAIISSLRNYAYSGKDTFKRYDAIICIKDALLLLQNNYKYRITIIEEFPESLELDCVPGKLNQLFVNLINNAIQAITDKGSITLTAEYRDMHTAVFKIKDTGKGISSNELNKIFDPFFTTKEVGQGTGLGLYIVHGIIGLHKGKIEVESIIGEGTVFTIYIPLIHQDLES